MAELLWVPAKVRAAVELPEHRVRSGDNPLLRELDDLESAPSPARDHAAAAPLAGPSSTAPAPHACLLHPTRLDRAAVKAHVLKTYTTTEPISTFIELSDGASEEMRARMRAERLATSSSTTPAEATTQVDLVAHVEGLDRDLRSHWERCERVRSVRVVIQAIKMLCTPKVPQCYPSIFMLVSYVMDTFGDFVARRLQELAAAHSPTMAALVRLGADSSADMIPAEATEICTNWFLKISSIRELVPRVCVEVALLKCSRYVAKKMRVNLREVAARLSGQIRGIADPLVAAHVRWYLFLRVGEALNGATEWAAPLETAFVDQLDAMARRNGVSCGDLNLYAPALQWMLDTLLAYGDRSRRDVIIRTATERLLAFRHPAMLGVLLRAVPLSSLVGATLDDVTTLIGNFTTVTDRCEGVSVLARALVVPGGMGSGTSRGNRNALLSTLHGLATLDEAPIADFLRVCESLLLLAAAQFGPRQLHVVLRIVRGRLSAEDSSAFEAPLTALIAHVVGRYSPAPLLSSPDLLPLVRLVSSGGRATIVTGLLRAVPTGEANAPVALELCRQLEQCSALSADEYSRLVVSTLFAVAPRGAANTDALLAFLCEARHTLVDSDTIRVALVAMAVAAVRGMEMTRKRRPAAKVLLAFCHVTMPAVCDPFWRARCAIDAGAGALTKGLLHQGEELLLFAAAVLRELPPMSTSIDGTVTSNDGRTRDVALSLLAAGCVAPENDAHGPLYLVAAVLRWAAKHHWPNMSAARFSVMFAIVRVCSRLLRGAVECRYPLLPGMGAGAAAGVEANEATTAAMAAAVAALQIALHWAHGLRAAGHDAAVLGPLLAGIALEGLETCLRFAQCSRNRLAAAAAAYWWTVGRSSPDAAIAAGLERAKAAAAGAYTEEGVLAVLATPYAQDLDFQMPTLQAAAPGTSGAAGGPSSNAAASEAGEDEAAALDEVGSNGLSGEGDGIAAAAAPAADEADLLLEAVDASPEGTQDPPAATDEGEDIL